MDNELRRIFLELLDKAQEEGAKLWKRTAEIAEQFTGPQISEICEGHEEDIGALSFTAFQLVSEDPLLFKHNCRLIFAFGYMAAKETPDPEVWEEALDNLKEDL